MNKSRNNPFSRRSALKAAAGCGLMSNTAIMSQFINLQATKAVAAGNNPTDHKAIVCVFLAGAIDSWNWMSPYDGTDTTGERGSYLTARNGQRNAGNPNLPGFNPGIGLGLRKNGNAGDLTNNDYLNTQIAGNNGAQAGRNFGLHPGCGFEADPATVGNSQQTGAAGGYLYTGLNNSTGANGSGTGIAGLYREGNLAFVSNVGSLPYRITRSDYNSNSFQNGLPARPLGLFSHSDLQRHWQTSLPQSRAQVNGWGGRLADCFQMTNGETSVSMNMSINGVNIFQTGGDVVPYTVGQGATATGANGANTLNDYPLGTQTSYEDRAFNTLTDGILDPVGNVYQDLVARSFQGQNLGSIQAAIDFNQATNSINLATPYEYGGGGQSDLSRRLRQVAKIIGCSNPGSLQYNAGTSLNQKRQVFFVQEGGWDHHANMITSMDGKIHEVSKALTSFYRSLEELGIADDVVTFTASDFGRTLRTNGIGSDHAWGGNHIIMGGGMGTKGTGGKIYGSYPTSLANPTDGFVGNLDVGQRRLIPTTGVDEFAGEIARWYGIDNQDDLKIVLPNIGEFYSYSGAAFGGPLGIL